tara:strand:- start:3286 stop:3426 length:141 start_codon:yes stop_codon:yes gene_type:complete
MSEQKIHQRSMLFVACYFVSSAGTWLRFDASTIKKAHLAKAKWAYD